MTTIDWIALGVVALAAIAGLRKGLVASALSMAGIVAGAIVGARLAPELLRQGSRSPYTPLVALAGAVVLAAVLQTVGSLLGSLFRQGTRLTLRHTGMSSRDAAMANAIGWETSLARLGEILVPQRAPAER